MKTLLPSNNEELASVRRRALNGDGHSCLALGLCFMRGVVVRRNYAFARAWLFKARTYGVAVSKYIDDCNEQQQQQQAKSDNWKKTRELNLQMQERDNRERTGLNQLKQEAAEWLKNKKAKERAKDKKHKQSRYNKGGGKQGGRAKNGAKTRPPQQKNSGTKSHN